MGERPAHERGERENPSGPEKRSGIRLGRPYQGGLEAGLAVVIGLGLGIFADSWLGTSPVFLFVGLGVGFGAFILRLVRLMNELNRPEGDARAGRAGEPDGGRGDER